MQKARWITAVLSACACVAMAACSPAEPQPQAPPPEAQQQAPPPPLAGGAPPPPPTAPGPYTSPRTGLDDRNSQIVTMNPIANPDEAPGYGYGRHHRWHGRGRRYEHVVRTAHGHRVIVVPHARHTVHIVPKAHPGAVVHVAPVHHAVVKPKGAMHAAPTAKPAAHAATAPAAGQSVTAPIAASASDQAAASDMAASDQGASDQAAQSDQGAGGLTLPSLPHFLAKLTGQTASGAPAQGGLHLSGRAVIAIFLAAIALVILLLIQKNMADQRRDAERKRERERAAPRRPLNLDGGDPPTT